MVERWKKYIIYILIAHRLMGFIFKLFIDRNDDIWKKRQY